MKKITLAIILAIYLLGMISFASALRIDSVSMTPKSIAPGETSKIDIVVKNNGENDITDFTISLDFTNLPLAPYNSGSDFSIDTIDSDKSKTTEFEVIALNTAKSGIYKIPVNIAYTEDDVKKAKQSMISLMVNSEPIIDVNVEDGLLLKGKENKMSIKIINKGLADVKFLEIEAGTSTSYILTSQKRVYIGDVDSNDFQTADFSLSFKENAPNTVNFPVSVYYKDITNKEYNQDIVIPLKVYSQQQAQDLGLVAKSNTMIYVIGVVVLIILYVIYRLIRRRNKNSEYWVYKIKAFLILKLILNSFIALTKVSSNSGSISIKPGFNSFPLWALSKPYFPFFPLSM